MTNGLGRTEVVEVATERVEACMFVRSDGCNLNLFGGNCATGRVRYFRLLPFWISFHLAYESKKRADCSLKSSVSGRQQLTLLRKMALMLIEREGYAACRINLTVRGIG
jgi:hypothetical protein